MFVEFISRNNEKSLGLNLNKRNQIEIRYFLNDSNKKSSSIEFKYNFFLKYPQFFRILYGKKKTKIKYTTAENYEILFLELKKRSLKWKRDIGTIKSKIIQENKIVLKKLNYNFSQFFKFNRKNEMKSKKGNFFLQKINLKSRNNLFNINCLTIEKI